MRLPRERNERGGKDDSGMEDACVEFGMKMRLEDAGRLAREEVDE